MSELPPARRRIWWKLLGLFCVLSVIVLGLLGWYVTTDSFQQRVRRRVVAELEKATGGRVEVGEFHTIPFRLRLDIRNLVIHGREAPAQVPYLRVDRLQAEIKIISLLSTTIGLHSLVLEHPVVHIIVYPDGSTNQPAPLVSRSSGKQPVEELFALSVSHIEVQRGELLWEENRIPLDLEARDFSVTLRYSFLRRHYETRLVVGSAATRIRQNPPFTWRADAALILDRDRADISVLTVASGKSDIHFSGSVQDFHNPQVSGNYHGALDLAELAALARQNEVGKGTAHFEGRGSWSLRSFSTEGTLAAKDVEWSNGRLKTQNGRFGAAFSVTPQRLHVSSIKASLFGGDLQGDLDVTNWQTSLEPQPSPARRRVIGRVPAGSPQRGSVRLQLAGFPLAPAVALVSARKVPLDQLNLSGTASGKLEILWVGSIRDAETRVNLNIAPPQQPVPGQLAVRGQIAGVYRGSRDELQLDQFHLNTPASEITASGNLSATSSLKVAATSHDPKEWRPLLQAAYGSGDLPFTIHGWANFNGIVAGRISFMQVNGNLEVYDFETALPASDHRPSRTVHWDALTATVQYSSKSFAAHNGALIHGHTTARFDASSALVAGVSEPSSPVTLHLDLRNADVAEIAHLAGSSRPLTGVADLSFNASGTRAHPHGEGRLEIRDASLYGAPVSFLRSDLRLAEDELQFNNMEASVYDAPLTGNAAVKTSANQFRLNLSGRNLDLARFPKLQSSRFAVDGKADFTANVSGTAEQHSLEAHVHFRDLAFDKEHAGDFDLDAVTQGRQLAIQGHSKFDEAELKIQGAVVMENDFPADLDLSFRHLDVDSLLNIYLPGKITGHSTLAGTISLHGPLRTPRQLKVSANLDSLSAEIAHVRLQNAEPVRFEIVDQVLRIENFHLSGSGTDFTAHGQAQLVEPRQIDFRLDGTINMALAQTLNPKISARGMLGLNLSAGGTLSSPVLQGRFEVKDTFVSHNDFPSGLSDLNGVLLFDQNRIQIESLRGATGGGTINLTGFGSYHNGVFLMDVSAAANDVRLRYPPGVSSTANANLRLAGSTNSALLSGEVFVTKLGVTPGFDFAAYLEKSKRSMAVAGPDTLANRLRLDVHVVTTPELQMQTAIAKLTGNADLRVKGTADRPVAVGRVNANEGGEISFNGTKYRLERGEVTFSNPAKTEPIIDVQAATRVRDYDITVNISGDVSKANGLKATWHSEPPLPEADVIALLALGRTREESAALRSGASGFGGEASNLLISEALNTAVSSRVQRLFGVSRIKIDPQGMSSETNIVRGPQVTIEQQVASNLTVTYSTNVSVASQQIIQVEYNVTRNISIVALRDQNGVVSFDVKIRQRKR
ncbi:MAG: translocation/assembly module TamB domain-containing protein [Terriglobales bacterium]